MNKAFEILEEIGFVFIYVYSYANDEYPEKVKSSDIEEISYYYANYFDVSFSRN